MSSEDPEKQDMAPLNAILDLLDSNSNGAFETFEIHRYGKENIRISALFILT